MTEDDGYETIVPDMKCVAVKANSEVPAPSPSEIWDAAYNQALKDAAEVARARAASMDHIPDGEAYEHGRWVLKSTAEAIERAILSLGDKGNG